MLVSAIIPVYLKPQQFLRECIESILMQTLGDFELILIDDASPDRSWETLKYYANKDLRIKIINVKRNCGVAAARNLGLLVAQGKYISFIDSDDIVAPHYFEILVRVAERFNLDIASACVTNFRQTCQLKPLKPFCFNRIFQLKEIPFRTLSIQHFVCRIFLRSLIQDLHFDENLRTGEDILFIHKALLLSNRCIEIDYKGYYYRHPPEEELKAYRRQFCPMEQRDDAGLRRVEEALHLVQQLCMLKALEYDYAGVQFVYYLSTRRFLRYSNFIWKLPREPNQIFYWKRFKEVFEKQIYPPLKGRFLGAFLHWIFSHGRPFLGVRISIYLARVFFEIYHVKQNINRLLKPIKFYFKGAIC